MRDGSEERKTKEKPLSSTTHYHLPGIRYCAQYHSSRTVTFSHSCIYIHVHHVTDFLSVS